MQQNTPDKRHVSPLMFLLHQLLLRSRSHTFHCVSRIQVLFAIPQFFKILKIDSCQKTSATFYMFTSVDKSCEGRFGLWVRNQSPNPNSFLNHRVIPEDYIILLVFGRTRSSKPNYSCVNSVTVQQQRQSVEKPV